MMITTNCEKFFFRRITPVADGIVKDSSFTAEGDQLSEHEFREEVSSPFIGKPKAALEEAARHHSRHVMAEKARKAVATVQLRGGKGGARPLLVDLGCGFGWHWIQLAREFPEVDFLLIDFALSNLRVCRSLMPVAEYPNVLCLLGDITSTPVSKQRAHLCWSVQVMQHLPDRIRKDALLEMKRILAADGGFYIAWLRSVPFVRLTRLLTGRSYISSGTVGQMFLRRYDDAVAGEFAAVFGSTRLSYSESLFHPDIRLRPSSALAGKVDMLLSSTPIAPLLARQAEIGHLI